MKLSEIDPNISLKDFIFEAYYRTYNASIERIKNDLFKVESEKRMMDAHK